MKSRRCTWTFVAVLMVLGCAVTMAKEKGQGRGKDKQKQEQRYSRKARNEMKAWYRKHQGNLPPGLAKKDRLPPGLEKRLRVRGTLPPDMRDYIRPCPKDLVRVLPPPPPDCEHVAIGGRIVLLNRRTSIVVDIVKLL